MALSEAQIQDKIEIVALPTYKIILVRNATVISRDGVEISRSFHRHTLSPRDDVSDQSDEVKALAAIYFTDEAKAAQKVFDDSIASKPDESRGEPAVEER